MDSIKLKVKILPSEYLDEITSKKELEIKLAEKSTVNCLLLKLSEILGPSFQKHIYNPETRSLIQNTIIILNEEILQKPDDLKTDLFDGDEIIIGKAYTQG